MVVFTLISLSGLAALAAMIVALAAALAAPVDRGRGVGRPSSQCRQHRPVCGKPLRLWGERARSSYRVLRHRCNRDVHGRRVSRVSGTREPRRCVARRLQGAAIWAVLLAVVAVQTGWSLPFPLARTVDLLGKACIPAFLIILGMQLHGKGLGTPLVPLRGAAGIRLIGGPLWGMLLARLVGLDGPAHQAAVLQSAMPSAVVCIVLATQYDVEPAFATSVVFFTTDPEPAHADAPAGDAGGRMMRGCRDAALRPMGPGRGERRG